MGEYLPIGERLREQRESLGMNQTAFAAAAGVSRKTLFGYETGERSPDASALAAWGRLGLDVLYVVTGLPMPGDSVRKMGLPGQAVRDAGVERGRAVEELRAAGALPAQSVKAGMRGAAQQTQVDLPPDEQLLLDSYRALSTPKKKQLLAELLTGAPTKKPGKAGGVTVTGNGNRTAGGTYHEK